MLPFHNVTRVLLSLAVGGSEPPALVGRIASHANRLAGFDYLHVATDPCLSAARGGSCCIQVQPSILTMLAGSYSIAPRAGDGSCGYEIVAGDDDGLSKAVWRLVRSLRVWRLARTLEVPYRNSAACQVCSCMVCGGCVCCGPGVGSMGRARCCSSEGRRVSEVREGSRYILML